MRPPDGAPVIDGLTGGSGPRPSLTLAGVFSVLPTPFSDDGRLDSPGLERLVAAHVAAGVAGLTVLGVMGEAAELTESERRTVLRVVRASAAGLPLIVGVSGPSAAAVAERALGAAADGAAALMISPARTLPLAEAVDAAALADLPLVVQDYPIASGVEIGVADLVDLAVAQRLVIGVKVEAPPTSGKIENLRAVAPSLRAAGGLGALFLIDELAAGASATMTGFPLPRALVEIVAGFATDPAAAEAAWVALLPLLRLEAFTPLNLAMRKEVWRLQGVIGSAHCRRAGVRLDDRARRDIERSWRAAASGSVGSGDVADPTPAGRA